jgi:hypothetical protein
MKPFNAPRFLSIYSGLLTAALVLAVLFGFRLDKPTRFDTIDVNRINIVEPDGTIRMVISDKSQFPGVIIKGKEQPHPDRETAGMLFFNDEGSENGGLIFGGAKDKNGEKSNYGHLSFDEYEQDQVFVVEANQNGDRHQSGLVLADNPNYPITDLMTEVNREKSLPEGQRSAALKLFFSMHGQSRQRLYLGRDDNGSVALKMKDAKGRDRIIIEVGADGSPAIRFLDQAGKITHKWTDLPSR